MAHRTRPSAMLQQRWASTNACADTAVVVGLAYRGPTIDDPLDAFRRATAQIVPLHPALYHTYTSKDETLAWHRLPSLNLLEIVQLGPSVDDDAQLARVLAAAHARPVDPAVSLWRLVVCRQKGAILALFVCVRLLRHSDSVASTMRRLTAKAGSPSIALCSMRSTRHRQRLSISPTLQRATMPCRRLLRSSSTSSLRCAT